MDSPTGGPRVPRMNVMTLPELSQTTLLYISLCLAALFLLAAVHFARKRSKARGSLVLLVGAADAGKTSILSTMVYGQTLPTHTSMFVNSSVVASRSSAAAKPLCVVDVPGHQRLRAAFKDHIPDAKAIVFVVDAGSITRNAKVVAEYLHQVLHAITSLPPTHALPPVLILAHKADLVRAPHTSSAAAASVSTATQDRAALAVSRVRTVLERELDARRAAQASGVGVERLGEEGQGTELGGLDCTGGGAFRFADWDGSEVSFVGSWVASGKSLIGASSEKSEKAGGLPDGGLDGVRDWLDALS